MISKVNLAIQKLIMKTIFLLVLSIGVFSNSIKAQQNIKQDTIVFPSADHFNGAEISYTIITAKNNTWCYDILLDGRLFIHQPSVPGLPGNEGFKTKDRAMKVAKLVISKMKMGEIPPSISIEEMKNLNVI